MYDIDFLIKNGDGGAGGAETITNIQDVAYRKIDSGGEFILLFDVGDANGLTVDDMRILHAVRKRVYEVISGPALTVTIDFSILVLGEGILGQAGFTHTTTIDERVFPYKGIMQLNKESWASQKASLKKDNNTNAYYTVLHEVFHVLGIGTLWDSLITNREYTGVHALREYRNALGNQNLAFIPVEDDGGPGTADGHPEEGFGVVRTKNGILHPGLDRELMTGYAEILDEDDEPMILSRITVGFLDDLGYTVRYEGADEMLNPELSDWASYNNLYGGLMNPGQTATIYINSSTSGASIKNETSLYYRNFTSFVNTTVSKVRIESDGTLMIPYGVITYIDGSGVSSSISHKVETLVSADSPGEWDLSYINGTISTIEIKLKGMSYDYDATYFA
jgi:hypothetical protein